MSTELCNATSNDNSYITVHKIVTEDLMYRKVCSRCILRQLLDEHKRKCMGAALEFLSRYESEGEPMLERIVTGDETLVHLHPTPPDEKNNLWCGRMWTKGRQWNSKCAVGWEDDVYHFLGLARGYSPYNILVQGLKDVTREFGVTKRGKNVR